MIIIIIIVFKNSLIVIIVFNNSLILIIHVVFNIIVLEVFWRD